MFLNGIEGRKCVIKREIGKCETISFGEYFNKLVLMTIAFPSTLVLRISSSVVKKLTTLLFCIVHVLAIYVTQRD